MKIEYNNKILEMPEQTTAFDIIKNEKNFRDIIAIKFNNEIKDLNFQINQTGKIENVDYNNADGRRIYIRGMMFILDKAIQDLYPGLELIINYQLSNAVFCEVENLDITEEMIRKIKNKMNEIINKEIPIRKVIMNKEQAIEFYNKEKTTKGKLQLYVENKKEISLYYCENYFNYFYGVMPRDTSYIKVFDIVKYKDGLLIRYPSKYDKENLTQFKETKKLFTTLNEYEDIHRVLDINTVEKLNKINKEGNITDYILLAEALHEKKIANIADSILRKKEIKVVLIAGPSSSGKTTFSKRLGLQLKLNGFKPVNISVDNYFVERDFTPKDEYGKFDFESINAIDLDLFNDHLNQLLQGKTVEVPKFNFTTGSKEYDGTTMSLADDEILVIEGIHCLNDELTKYIPKDKKYKIYISALTVLNIDNYNRISTTDTRLIRRIVRDKQFRNYSALHTLQMWPSVNRGEEKNIFPFQEEADFMFNSSLIYELGVLKKYAMPLLKEIENTEDVYSEAKRLYTLLNYFEEIEDINVPETSLLKEFTGGSVFKE